MHNNMRKEGKLIIIRSTNLIKLSEYEGILYLPPPQFDIY